MAELNEPQAMAVTHAEGPLLIFAGAGSGKTRTITYRIANLLAQHRVPPYRILAVTFTNKAAAEMRGRLRELAGESLAGDLWAGTFHSVCVRLLRRHHEAAGLSRDFVIYDDSDQKAVMARLIRELGWDDKEFNPKIVLGLVHAAKREAREPKDMPTGDRFQRGVQQLFVGYEAAMRRANAVDFEDLILLAMRLAESRDSQAGEELRSQFEHVLVDEFQDTNWTQYRLVRALSAKTRNLCVVGDDDQSIYRWRGADVRIIRGFREDFADATVVKLEQNYRSTGNIVRAALGVIAPSRQREPKSLWTAEADGEPVLIRAVEDERAEGAWVAQRLAESIRRGVDPRQVAVFYRVHAQSRVLEEAMRSERIPYQIIGGMRFFERAEVKDLLAYLRLLVNPRSDADFLRVVNVPARGIGDKTVATLGSIAARRDTSLFDAVPAACDGDELGTAPRKKLEAFVRLIDSLRGELSESSPHELAGRVLDACGYREFLEKQDDAESDARLENLEELLGSIAEYEYDASQAGETPSLEGYLERITLVSAVDGMKDVPSVSLMTVHAAKGLEFEEVWLTGMEEEIFPYRGLDGRDHEELDEERRLAYVAITRARQRLRITHASCRTLFGRMRWLEPSRFLSDIPGEVVRREGGRRSEPARNTAPGWSAYGGGARPTVPQRPAPARAVGERWVEREREAVGEGFELRPGDRVQHQRFGVGTVERIELGAAPSVVAHFPGFGSRKVLASFLTPG